MRYIVSIETDAIDGGMMTAILSAGFDNIKDAAVFMDTVAPYVHQDIAGCVMRAEEDEDAGN